MVDKDMMKIKFGGKTGFCENVSEIGVGSTVESSHPSAAPLNEVWHVLASQFSYSPISQVIIGLEKNF